MTVLAFLYDDYSCYGIQNSMAGVWGDSKDAREALVGAEYERRNLEILDTETFGIEKYRWESRFESAITYSDKPNNPSTMTLTERYPGYGKTPMKFVFKLVDGNVPGEYKLYYESGWWNRQ